MLNIPYDLGWSDGKDAYFPRLTHTVNLDIFAQSLFTRSSRMALAVRKYDASEKTNKNSTKRINWYLWENLGRQRCLLKLDARKYLRLQYIILENVIAAC